MTMAQRLTFRQRKGGIYALHNFSLGKAEIFRAKRHFFLHAESTT